MYLHLGQSISIPYTDIVGIFDLDTASWSKQTRTFLQRAEQEKRVVAVTEELPKSFALCQHALEPSRIYLSQLSSATLKSRMESLTWDSWLE